VVDFLDFSQYQTLVDGITVDYVFGAPAVVRFYKLGGPYGNERKYIAREELDKQVRDRKVADRLDDIRVRAVNRLQLDASTPTESLTEKQLLIGRMTKREWSLSDSFRRLYGPKSTPQESQGKDSSEPKEGPNPKVTSQ